jgi:hypothetical protein
MKKLTGIILMSRLGLIVGAATIVAQVSLPHSLSGKTVTGGSWGDFSGCGCIIGNNTTSNGCAYYSGFICTGGYPMTCTDDGLGGSGTCTDLGEGPCVGVHSSDDASCATIHDQSCE